MGPIFKKIHSFLEAAEYNNTFDKHGLVLELLNKASDSNCAVLLVDDTIKAYQQYISHLEKEIESLRK